MKILLISHSPNFYGAERSLFDLAKGLVCSGYDISVLCPGPGQLPQKLKKLGIPVFYMPFPGIGNGSLKEILRFIFLLFPSVIRLHRWIKKNKFNIVYNNTINLIQGSLAAKIVGIKSVWHIREVKPKGPFLTKIGGIVIRLLSSEAVFNSHATMKAFRNCPLSSWHVIYNGIEPSSDEKKDNHSPFVIGFAGQMIEHKRPERFLCVFSKVKAQMEDIKGIMAGDGRMLSSLHALAVALEITDDINFTGYLSDLESFYSDIDIFVLTSDYEPFGRVIMEAMSHGCAVVAAAVDGVPELVEDGQTGYLVPAGDINAYSQKIMSLINDPENCRRMGAAGRRRVAEHFSKSRYQQEIIRILTGGTG